MPPVLSPQPAQKRIRFQKLRITRTHPVVTAPLCSKGDVAPVAHREPWGPLVSSTLHPILQSRVRWLTSHQITRYHPDHPEYVSPAKLYGLRKPFSRAQPRPKKLKAAPPPMVIAQKSETELQYLAAMEESLERFNKFKCTKNALNRWRRALRRRYPEPVQTGSYGYDRPSQRPPSPKSMQETDVSEFEEGDATLEFEAPVELSGSDEPSQASISNDTTTSLFTWTSSCFTKALEVVRAPAKRVRQVFDAGFEAFKQALFAKIGIEIDGFTKPKLQTPPVKPDSPVELDDSILDDIGGSGFHILDGFPAPVVRSRVKTTEDDRRADLDLSVLKGFPAFHPLPAGAGPNATKRAFNYDEFQEVGYGARLPRGKFFDGRLPKVRPSKQHRTGVQGSK